MAHKCHLDICDREVPPAMLMCSTHWWMVPTRIKRDVWEAYRPGQEVDKRYTPQYYEAQMAARRAVLGKIADGGCHDPGDGGCLGTCITHKARAALAQLDKWDSNLYRMDRQD